MGQCFVRGGVGFVLTLLLALSAAAQEPKIKRMGSDGKPIFLDLSQAVPLSPNPWLSFLPDDVAPDWEYWNAYARQASADRRAIQGPSPALLAIAETEPNNSPATADFIPSFGTGGGDDPEADVTGNVSAGALPPPTPAGPFAEDDGSIPLANPTSLVPDSAISTTGTIGDGPHGSAGTGNGDFDFFRLSNVPAGQQITINMDTAGNGVIDLDPFVALWNSAGDLLAFNDDQADGADGFDSFLQFTSPALDNYYVSIGSFGAAIPIDPFDSGSGLGAGTEGGYSVYIGMATIDVDFFSFNLAPGDVISANVTGAATQLALFDPDGVFRISSAQEVSFIYPPESPLPGGGNASFAYVTENGGRWAVGVAGNTGAYTLELRVFRPGLESEPEDAKQILFVDFNGATINPVIFGGPNSNRALSPLSSFLPGWGLVAGDLNDVIDAILSSIEESINEDCEAFGLNPNFGVDIRNSRDNADPFGQSYVSRLIVGGTISQLGLSTIGIAESIDPGNFAFEETAVILLDLLSTGATNPNSLNQFAVNPPATMVDLVGVGVGNITSHEAGHYLGSFHTAQINEIPNIMDQGGNLPNSVGVGPDLTFNTADDADVDFGFDIYVPNEGFNGVENTLDTTAFALYMDMGDVCCRDGDVDQNCDITPGDALLAFQSFLEQSALDECQSYHADVDSPTTPPTVTPGDALCIFNFFLERDSCIDQFPQSCTDCDNK
jgi:hypothetical protein